MRQLQHFGIGIDKHSKNDRKKCIYCQGTGSTDGGYQCSYCHGEGVTFFDTESDY